ncbi:hypothetical protein I5J50_gp63 [Mycobacterium phage Purky]|uniref:Uncharacterized protein n=1 Tax=Mycobacterium phage Purky TaxID=2593351 RepID=A0A514TWV0_9CAUD|nr:hypothetical protein I5J50_gp63 [Mycobacterium phage Purky]QDK01166.1 hypothetical protein SEA_PURKY_63 [Mycobacterium phage Purky]
MSDPAVEAAQRAWGFESNWEFNDRTTGGMSVAAAREMAKPIRNLHNRVFGFRLVPKIKTGNRELFCKHCHVKWPCPTAKLVYTSEELSGE